MCEATVNSSAHLRIKFDPFLAFLAYFVTPSRLRWLQFRRIVIFEIIWNLEYFWWTILTRQMREMSRVLLMCEKCILLLIVWRNERGVSIVFRGIILLKVVLKVSFILSSSNFSPPDFARINRILWHNKPFIHGWLSYLIFLWTQFKFFLDFTRWNIIFFFSLLVRRWWNPRSSILILFGIFSKGVTAQVKYVSFKHGSSQYCLWLLHRFHHSNILFVLELLLSSNIIAFEMIFTRSLLHQLLSETVFREWCRSLL